MTVLFSSHAMDSHFPTLHVLQQKSVPESARGCFSQVGAGLFPFLNAAGGVSSSDFPPVRCKPQMGPWKRQEIRFETRFGKVDIHTHYTVYIVTDSKLE